MRRLGPALALALVLAVGGPAPGARADGDPGSDVLVNQPLFLNGDAGISIPEQVSLGNLLHAAARGGFPVRVAIIASPQDLGAITGLWRKPRTYARFLGLELPLAYTGRLLVVMPNGFGFNWPGHASTAAYAALSHIPIGPGGEDPRAARLSDRDQRVGFVVRPVPLRVHAARQRVGPLRAPCRVPRGR